tara:strand:- start:556 stop:942 length:387 start_codon:yes stop_codon:yes gene_type:complete
MKRKKPKNKPIDTWRDVKLRLPANFVKGLSDVRDEDGNAYSLPVARGNAIMNRMAYALKVSESLAVKLNERTGQLTRAMELLQKFETRMKENGVEYADLLEAEEVHDESGTDTDDSNVESERGDVSEN